MDTIKFYKMLGFDTILDCCYILGNYGEEDLVRLYWDAWGTYDEYDYIFLYKLINPLYKAMHDYVGPSKRKNETLAKIIKHGKILEMVTEDRFTQDTYDYIRNRIESSLMVYGYTIEDAVKGWQETIWVGQED